MKAKEGRSASHVVTLRPVHGHSAQRNFNVRIPAKACWVLRAIQAGANKLLRFRQALIVPICMLRFLLRVIGRNLFIATEKSPT